MHLCYTGDLVVEVNENGEVPAFDSWWWRQRVRVVCIIGVHPIEFHHFTSDINSGWVLWLVFGWLFGYFGCAFDSINSGPVDHKFEYPSISLLNQDYSWETLSFSIPTRGCQDFVPRRPTI